MEPGFVSVVLSNRTRGNRQKLMCRKFHLNMRKNFFTVPGTDCPERIWSFLHWRQPRTLWMQSCARFSRTTLLDQEVGVDDPLVQPYPIYDFVNRREKKDEVNKMVNLHIKHICLHVQHLSSKKFQKTQKLHAENGILRRYCYHSRCSNNSYK